jgi:hypothetical protein
MNAEARAIKQQNTDIAERILQALSKRDREVLIRYYLDEQSAEEIQTTMGLTATQFRLIKSRAKARFTEMSKRRLSLRGGNGVAPDNQSARSSGNSCRWAQSRSGNVVALETPGVMN